jgi:hypothetical protein
LAFDDIQRNLVKKDPSIGQNKPDGDDGKSQGRVVVFQGDEQIMVPLSMFWEFCLNVESFQGAVKGFCQIPPSSGLYAPLFSSVMRQRGTYRKGYPFGGSRNKK